MRTKSPAKANTTQSGRGITRIGRRRAGSSSRGAEAAHGRWRSPIAGRPLCFSQGRRGDLGQRRVRAHGGGAAATPRPRARAPRANSVNAPSDKKHAAIVYCALRKTGPARYGAPATPDGDARRLGLNGNRAVDLTTGKRRKAQTVACLRPPLLLSPATDNESGKAHAHEYRTGVRATPVCAAHTRARRLENESGRAPPSAAEPRTESLELDAAKLGHQSAFDGAGERTCYLTPDSSRPSPLSALELPRRAPTTHGGRSHRLSRGTERRVRTIFAVRID
ncbi:hypothetical protein EVAR_55222_1 [Eumeta japonica]|uniref:Uncharacterized protein n=1 Tax=Eumeta variegata TaxID=151549 RepID=A0A4C1ZQB9_EUMVA|nr:hypothetical protein EVAR_55222_1 [Eumeta japonica]